MSDYQYKSYKTVASDEGPFRTGDILKLPNNFFIGSRLISNIAFPKKGINQDGYNLLAEDKLLMIDSFFKKIVSNIITERCVEREKCTQETQRRRLSFEICAMELCA